MSKYALIDTNNTVTAISTLNSPDDWSHPNDMYIVSADNFEPEFPYSVSDYLYINEEFILNEEKIIEQEAKRTIDPFEVISALMQEVPQIFDTLSDTILSHMAGYMAEWNENNITYTKNDRVQYEGYPYRCLQSHISQQNWSPVDAPSLWARIIVSEDPNNPLPWMQPDSTNPYMQGDRVIYNDQIWESDVDNNVWEPGVYGWHVV